MKATSPTQHALPPLRVDAEMPLPFIEDEQEDDDDNDPAEAFAVLPSSQLAHLQPQQFASRNVAFATIVKFLSSSSLENRYGTTPLARAVFNGEPPSLHHPLPRGQHRLPYAPQLPGPPCSR